MDNARVALLLGVWEDTVAPLRACRTALDAANWDVDVAAAALAGDEVPRSPDAQDQAAQDKVDRPTAILGKLKDVLREHRDVSMGTLPRSVV